MSDLKLTESSFSQPKEMIQNDINLIEDLMQKVKDGKQLIDCTINDVSSDLIKNILKSFSDKRTKNSQENTLLYLEGMLNVLKQKNESIESIKNRITPMLLSTIRADSEQINQEYLKYIEDYEYFGEMVAFSSSDEAKKLI
jgi:hypothetical protein